MRNTLLGMIGAATLAVGLNANAEGLRDEAPAIASTTVHRAGPDERMRIAYSVEEVRHEAMDPCDASATAGSASGEPSTKKADEGATRDRSASHEEFLRDVWTTP